MRDPSRIDDPSWRPRAVEGLERHASADGYILYQADRDRVHQLNPTAAILLALCNGRNRVTDLPALLQLAYGLAEAPTAETRAGLEQLIAETLII